MKHTNSISILNARLRILLGCTIQVYIKNMFCLNRMTHLLHSTLNYGENRSLGGTSADKELTVTVAPLPQRQYTRITVLSEQTLVLSCFIGHKVVRDKQFVLLKCSVKDEQMKIDCTCKSYACISFLTCSNYCL